MCASSGNVEPHNDPRHRRHRPSGARRRWRHVPIQFSNSGGYGSAFSRHEMPEVCVHFSPSRSRGRRESRVRAAPAVSRANAHSKTHTSIQVQRRQSGLPCAVVYDLFRALPGEPGSFATVIREKLASHELSASVGRQDHTTSPSASATFVFVTSASTASHRNVPDDRDPPLIWVRRAESNH
jgi:hypothetical protein